MATKKSRYSQIIESIFEKYHKPGSTEVAFERPDIIQAAKELEIQLPKNLGDVLYSFRYRQDLPDSIASTAPEGKQWIIRPAGRARYRFALLTACPIVPSEMLAETKIPDSTPGIISKYALSDEQALLAKVRYNRLLDIFTGFACYSLQSHLRTAVPDVGQVETDEIYIGIDKRGAHYILTVQAKRRNEKVGIVQIEQDLALCAAKFPHLICRPVAVQFMDDDLIAMFEFEETDDGIRISSEKHYRLVAPEDLTPEDLENYSRRNLD